MARNGPPLTRYRARRNFRVTSEPSPSAAAAPSTQLRFMVHKHDATRLHYDLRLESDGVLGSWACPKGPSYDPAQKRLAVETEDHPLAYGDFEGRIPEGEYGAGDSIIWDRGTLWLFFKAKDGTERPGFDVIAERPESVQSGRTVTRGPLRKSVAGLGLREDKSPEDTPLEQPLQLGKGFFGAEQVKGFGVWHSKREEVPLTNGERVIKTFEKRLAQVGDLFAPALGRTGRLPKFDPEE